MTRRPFISLLSLARITWSYNSKGTDKMVRPRVFKTFRTIAIEQQSSLPVTRASRLGDFFLFRLLLNLFLPTQRRLAPQRPADPACVSSTRRSVVDILFDPPGLTPATSTTLRKMHLGRATWARRYLNVTSPQTGSSRISTCLKIDRSQSRCLECVADAASHQS